MKRKRKRKQRDPRTTSDVRIEITDGRINRMRNIGDVIGYYSDQFPVQLGREARGEINITCFPRNKEVAARMNFSYKDRKHKINYEVVFYRERR